MRSNTTLGLAEPSDRSRPEFHGPSLVELGFELAETAPYLVDTGWALGRCAFRGTRPAQIIRGVG